MTYAFAAEHKCIYAKQTTFICRSTASSGASECEQILILFFVVSKKRPEYLSWLAVLFAGFWCACSHHSDELQMFTEFVSAKLENTTVTPDIPFRRSRSLSHSPSVTTDDSAVPFTWMAVSFKVSLLCESV